MRAVVEASAPLVQQACDALSAAFAAYGVHLTGEAFLARLGVSDVSVPVAWLVLIAITVVLRALAFGALSLRLRRRMA